MTFLQPNPPLLYLSNLWGTNGLLFFFLVMFVSMFLHGWFMIKSYFVEGTEAICQ